jgi:hypothetical protein
LKAGDSSAERIRPAAGGSSGSARKDKFLRRLLGLGGVEKSGDDGGRADGAIVADKRVLLGLFDFFLVSSHFLFPRKDFPIRKIISLANPAKS